MITTWGGTVYAKHAVEATVCCNVDMRIRGCSGTNVNQAEPSNKADVASCMTCHLAVPADHLEAAAAEPAEPANLLG